MSRLPFRLTAVWAVAAQASQGLTAFLILAVAARILPLAELGSLSILYGLLVLCAALTTGFVGDSLTVLDRREAGTRAGLLGWFLVLGLACTAAVPLAVWLLGLVTGGQAAGFAAAVAGYLLKDLLRRVLMAHLRFGGIVVMDAAVLPVTGGVLLLAHLPGLDSLGLFLAALAVGQAAGIAVGLALLPREERRLASLSGARWRQVAGFGTWRAAQQALRPALLTGLRTAVVLLLSLETAGLLEIARVYAAPAMQVVAGVSSYLFASFARSRDTSTAALLRRADRGVAVLLAMTAAGGAAALWLLPVAGPLITGRAPDTLAVAGWLAYAGATAAATPYGTLAAVRAGSLRVFLIRLADTVAALAAGLGILGAGGSYALVPLAAAAVALGGGIALRQFLLVPLAASRPEPEQGTEPEQGPALRASAGEPVRTPAAAAGPQPAAAAGPSRRPGPSTKGGRR